jgi:type IV pilus assembly protein PilB
MAVTVARRIGELLVEAGLLSQSQLEQALFAQRKDGRKLGQLLTELGLVSEVQLTQTLSRQLAVPWVSLYHVDFSRALLAIVSRETAEKYCLIPIFVRREGKQQGDTLFVAMDDPTHDAALVEVARASSLPVKPMIACPSDIRAAIRVYYAGEGTLAAVPSAPTLAPVPPSSPGAAPSPPASSPATASPAGVAPAPTSLSSLPPPPGPASSSRSVGPRSSQGPASAGTLSLTLLDGTKISLQARPRRRGSDEPGDPEPGDGSKDQLTARDLVSALRAVAHGVDASDVLGAEPRWEVLFSALLSILLRKGIIADWEFVEEFRKV